VGSMSTSVEAATDILVRIRSQRAP